MFTILASVLVALVVALLVYAATKPDTFRVQRSASINAPPEKIFALIEDYHRWPAWSPYEKLDPTMQRTYSGAAHGAGAVYEWEGNKKAGQGRMEITNVTPPSQITINLDFVRPFQAHNIVVFRLNPTGASAHITWAMHGPLPYVAKVMHMVFNMDRMVGKDFETGLANLKAIAEKLDR
jgi:uncharacterized protein YndB with AHSA1/START domain